MRCIGKGAALLVAAAVVLTCGLVRADVLEHVPSDALFVVKVNNLKGTSDKLGKFANELGLAAMAPPAADPLGFLQQQTKMVAGVNTAGEAAFAFLPPDQFGGNPENAMVLLIPVSDYQAFIGNWGPPQVEGDVAQVTIEGAPEPYFVSQRGEYAAFGRSRELVSRAVDKAVSFPESTSRQLEQKDMIVVANFDQLAPMILPKLGEGRQEMLDGMEREMTNDPDAQKFLPVARAFGNQFMNVVEGFVEGTHAATIGIAFDDGGMATTVIADFKQGSYPGELMASYKNSSPETMLNGLPAGKYLMFGGATGNSEVTGKAIDDFALPIVKELVALGPEYKPAEDYYQALRNYIQANKGGGSFGLLAPSGQIGTDSIVQVVSVLRGDAEKMQAAYRDMMTAQQNLMQAFGLPPEQFQVTHTPNAKTVGGVSFDAIKSEMNADPNDPSAQQGEEFIKMFYGPEGAVVYSAEVEGKLLQGVGVSDEVLAQAIESVKTDASPLAQLAGVQTVSQHLPKENLGVFYIAVDQIVTTALEYARQFNVGMPIQLPPDLPPVGTSVAAEGTALRVDVYVPTPLVQSLVAAGMQAAMQMQGGGGGGGL